LEVLEEDRFFISRRLSKRDHVDPRRRLSGHETLLVVREAIILEGESRPFKYSGCIHEVQTMLFQV